MSSKNKVDLTQMSKFSPEQQGCIVKLLIEDKEFRDKVIDLIDINSLNADESIREIGGIVKNLCSKNVLPNYDIIQMYINSSISEEIRREKCTSVLSRYIMDVKLAPASIQFLKDNVYPMLEFQEIRRFSGELQEMLRKEKGSKDEVMKLLEDFDKRTAFKDCTYEEIDCSIEAAKKLLEEDTYEYIPTSSKLINMALGGGLRKGDVGLLLAGSGVAKTCMSTSFVCDCAFRGKKVAHFVLEDKKDDILKKYVAFITNIGVYQQTKQKTEVLNRLNQYQKQYQKMVSNIRGVFATKNNGKIKIMSTKDIDKELERMVNDGFVPDMVVVDYYDRIKKNGKDIWLEDERIVNELLEIATKYNVALWAPTQGGKAAQNPNAELDMSNSSGGVWKSYGAQTFIAIQQKENGVFGLTVLKNRHYAKKNGLMFKFNNGTCRFENEDEQIKILNQMDECLDEMFALYEAQKVKNQNNK